MARQKKADETQNIAENIDLKVLQKNSMYAKYDINGDGTVSDEELAKAERFLQIENDDAKQDSQRKMTWVSVISMAVFPLLMLVAPETRLATLGAVADTFYIGLAGVVAAFFATQAYMTKN